MSISLPLPILKSRQSSAETAPVLPPLPKRVEARDYGEVHAVFHAVAYCGKAAIRLSDPESSPLSVQNDFQHLKDPIFYKASRHEAHLEVTDPLVIKAMGLFAVYPHWTGNDMVNMDMSLVSQMLAEATEAEKSAQAA